MPRVKVSRESQREFRSNEFRGRFVPLSSLATLAFELTSGRTQQEIARDLGISQRAVSQALAGRHAKPLLAIIQHYSEAPVEGPLWFVPERVDEQVMEQMVDLIPDSTSSEDE
jgi:predicted transcriptional regulator